MRHVRFSVHQDFFNQIPSMKNNFAHRLGVQEVVGSNPITLTNQPIEIIRYSYCFYLCKTVHIIARIVGKMRPIAGVTSTIFCTPVAWPFRGLLKLSYLIFYLNSSFIKENILGAGYGEAFYRYR